MIAPRRTRRGVVGQTDQREAGLTIDDDKKANYLSV
jgi:hypothetical protein